MIPIESLLYKIDQRLNKLGTSSHQAIALEDKILAIREGEIRLIKDKFAPTAPKAGMDGNLKRYQDLQSLVEVPEDHALPIRLSDPVRNRWVVDIADLKPAFLFFTEAYLLADKGDCKDRVITVNADLAAHASIALLLNNANYVPSFEYQETFCEISSDTIGVYTDGSFTPTKFFLSYLRYPVAVDYEGYEHFDGTASTTVNSELPLYLEDELLDLVTLSLASYTNNPATQWMGGKQDNS